MKIRNSRGANIVPYSTTCVMISLVQLTFAIVTIKLLYIA